MPSRMRDCASVRWRGTQPAPRPWIRRGHRLTSVRELVRRIVDFPRRTAASLTAENWCAMKIPCTHNNTSSWYWRSASHCATSCPKPSSYLESDCHICTQTVLILSQECATFSEVLSYQKLQNGTECDTSAVVLKFQGWLRGLVATNLPGDCVVEVSGYVDSGAIRITRVGDLPRACAATCTSSINVQRMGKEAALHGDMTPLM